MMRFTADTNVYLHKHAIDFRKQINGLSLIVQESLLLDPFSQSLFVFINRTRSRIKVLYWDRNGFCLWMKRLEKDRFSWPRHLDGNQTVITVEALHWLLDGFDIWHSPPHQRLHFASV
jgi:transposase